MVTPDTVSPDGEGATPESSSESLPDYGDSPQSPTLSPSVLERGVYFLRGSLDDQEGI